MTTIDGKCCGNCEAFMPDRFNSDQSACSVIDDECIAYASYHWVTIDGDLPCVEAAKGAGARSKAALRADGAGMDERGAPRAEP